MESPTKYYDQEELVIEKNALIHSRQTFTLLQQRILALAAAQIKRSDNGTKTYKVRIQDLVDLGTSKDLYNRLEEETRSLAGKVVTLKNTDEKGRRSFTHWSMISKAYHKEKTGVLEIQFHPEIRDMIFQLTGGEWSAAVAVELASCQSVYSVRIMKMLLSYWRYGEWEVPVKDLRFKLGLEKKYKNFSDFRRYVLIKAQKDLQKHTNMRFTWEELKKARGRGKGRKVTHIKFDFSWKPDQLNLPIEQSKKKSKFDIYDLRNRLKRDAQLSGKQIDRVMNFLEKNPDKREQFKNDFAPVSNRLQEGKDENNKPIKSPSKYSWPRIEPLLE